MKTFNFNYIFLFVLIFTVLLFPAQVSAQDSIVKKTHILLLGETRVKVNVYEKNGAPVTFVAPHFNERLAGKLARESIAKNGGRFVEIESFNQNGVPARQLDFNFKGKFYSIDPNRIYTADGRRCGGYSSEIERAVKRFADKFLKILLAPDGKSLRKGERFIIAVHNNNDVDDKAAHQKAGDLTATAFVKNIGFSRALHGAFQAQAAGAYLSNQENDQDNFVFLSSTQFIGFFVEKGFNVVVQKSASELQSGGCNTDDGSLSVFSSLADIPYICLEADAQSGGERQKRMIESVYQLSETIGDSEVEATTHKTGNRMEEQNYKRSK